MIAIPCDADRDDDVDVLYLAGQRPADDGEWLLITAVDGLPGAEFTARVLPDGGRCTPMAATSWCTWPPSHRAPGTAARSAPGPGPSSAGT